MRLIAVTACCLVALSCAASGYEQRIEKNGDHISAAFVWPAGTLAARGGPVANGPIAGNLYAFRGVFTSKDLSCDDFLAKTKTLISDWHLYPHMNLYALSFCQVPPDMKSSTEFIYAIDAWRPEAVPEVQAFLQAHRGLQFQGRALWFYAVNRLDVKTVLTLGLLRANGAVTPIHSAESWSSLSGTDQWYPANYERGKIIAQTSLGVFLSWVGRTFGDAEKRPFQKALGKADFVQFSDFFRLHLDDGQQADFWLGFGGNRKCGGQPCFAKKRPDQPPRIADKPSFRALARELDRLSEPRAVLGR